MLESKLITFGTTSTLQCNLWGFCGYIWSVPKSWCCLFLWMDSCCNCGRFLPRDSQKSGRSHSGTKILLFIRSISTEVFFWKSNLCILQMFFGLAAHLFELKRAFAILFDVLELNATGLAQGFAAPSSSKLLPDLLPQEQGTYTLVLDLNETLVYSDWKVSTQSCSFSLLVNDPKLKLLCPAKSIMHLWWQVNRVICEVFQIGTKRGVWCLFEGIFY